MEDSLILVKAIIQRADLWDEYKIAVAKSLENFGGKVVLRARASESANEHYAVLAFECQKNAVSWLNSEAYKSIVPLREQAAETEFIFMDRTND